MSIDPKQAFDDAADAYLLALHEPDAPAAEREAAATEFLGFAESFRRAGDAVLPILEAELSKETDPYYQDAAARLLTLHGSARAAERVLKACLDTSPPLDLDHLARLGSTAPLEEPLHSRLAEILRTSQGPERIALARALLRHPSERSHHLFDWILRHGDTSLAKQAVAAVSRWPEPPLAEALASEAPSVQVEAAFFLALGGARAQVEQLEALARGAPGPERAEAVVRLAWLAWPGAVPQVAALLRSATPEAAGLALDASGALRSAALGPALLELAARDIPGPSSFEPPLADDALRVLSRMTGAALPERPEAYTPMGVLTDQGREEARRAFQQRLQTLEPSRRYQEGQPLEYRHLVDELLSRHTGVAAAAAFNLRAMTGEDHGYEPYEDLVANVKAVQAWRARLTHLPALEPGDWLFAGAPVAPPS